MKSAVNLATNNLGGMAFQSAALDIWETKYRLTAKDGTIIDRTIDETYERVARALADVEAQPLKEKYFDEFLWALRNGAIPAGRIISNAGARQHKPATSTINCTVSGTVADSMDNILNKVHEAAHDAEIIKALSGGDPRKQRQLEAILGSDEAFAPLDPAEPEPE